MKVGDKVKYVPDKVHSRERDRNGNFPWVIGKKIKGGGVQEMSHNEYALMLRGLAKMPEEQRRRMMETLVHVRPALLWDATVRDVVDLPSGKQLVCVDIVSGTNPGITLHCDNVPVDETGVVPHTCCECGTVPEPTPEPENDTGDDEDEDDDK